MEREPDKAPSVFGRSLQLADGDLAMAAGDFTAVSGPENLLQGVRVMIETPLGTDIFNVNYGFDLLNAISQPQPAAYIKDLIRLNLVKSISQDDRVREIKLIAFDDEPQYYQADPLADPEANRRERARTRRWRAIIVLATVAEGEVAVKLEGVGL